MAMIMKARDEQTSDHENRLYELVAVCLEAKADARASTRAQLTADFPEFAGETSELCAVDTIVTAQMNGG